MSGLSFLSTQIGKSPAQLFTTGPAHFYVGTTARNGGAVPSAALYLGTTEGPPTIQLIPKYKPVYTQLAGEEIPYDLSYQGEEGRTIGEFNRFSESTVSLLQARPWYDLTENRGLNFTSDIGTLAMTEGACFALYILFPKAGDAAYTGKLPPGYRFPWTVLLGPDEMKNLGTTPRKNLFLFYSLRGFCPATGALGLYDFQVAGLPAPI